MQAFDRGTVKSMQYCRVQKFGTGLVRYVAGIEYYFLDGSNNRRNRAISSDKCMWMYILGTIFSVEYLKAIFLLFFCRMDFIIRQISFSNICFSFLLLSFCFASINVFFLHNRSLLMYLSLPEPILRLAKFRFGKYFIVKKLVIIYIIYHYRKQKDDK